MNKHTIDICAAGGIVATGLQWLPPLLAGLASAAGFIWYAIQIYDWLKNRKGK